MLKLSPSSTSGAGLTTMHRTIPQEYFTSGTRYATPTWKWTARQLSIAGMFTVYSFWKFKQEQYTRHRVTCALYRIKIIIPITTSNSHSVNIALWLFIYHFVACHMRNVFYINLSFMISVSYSKKFFLIELVTGDDSLFVWVLSPVTPMTFSLYFSATGG